MIKLCEDNSEFFNICDKLNSKKLKNIRLTQSKLYSLMTAGLFNKNIFTYVSYDNDKMNGCLTLIYAIDILGETVLSLLFVWIDAHYPNLHKEFIEVAIDKAKELKIDRICFQTNRKEKVIHRKMGKYGFKKIFSVYEKKVEIKKEVI